MRKVLKALLLTILAYLFQVCAMNQLKIGGVVANLLAVNIAILTVSLGKNMPLVRPASPAFCLR